MHTHAGQPADQVDAKVSIQDMLVIAKSTRGVANPVAEFHTGSVTETSEQLINRLYGYIDSLITQAADKHKTENCKDGQLKPDRMNNITRLVTNEFFFYTKAPFSRSEFEKLQQKIFELARNQPENLHLVLGTFAVKTADDKIMNVAVDLLCGKNPILNLAVKNHPSPIDPVYKRADGRIMQNVDSRRGHYLDNESPIVINGKSYFFDFNNVFECRTAGGVRFQFFLEICLDHDSALAMKNLEKYPFLRMRDAALEQISDQCSHVVISNSIDLEAKNCLGVVTHADPLLNKIEDCKKGVAILERKDNPDPVFGNAYKLIITQSAPCSLLPPEQKKLLDKYNKLAMTDYGVRANFSWEDAENFLKHISVTNAALADSYFQTEAISVILRPATASYNDVVLDLRMPHLPPPDDVKHIPIDDQFDLNFNGKEYESFSEYARAYILTEELKFLGEDQDKFIGFDDYVTRRDIWNITDEMERQLSGQDIGSYVIGPSALRGEEYLVVKLQSRADNVQEIEYKLHHGNLYRLTDEGEDEVASISTDINNLMFVRGVEANEYGLTDAEIKNYLRVKMPAKAMDDSMFQEIRHSQSDLSEFKMQAIKQFNADLISNWRRIKNSGLSRETAVASYQEISMQLQMQLLETLNKHLLDRLDKRYNEIQSPAQKVSEHGIFGVQSGKADKSVLLPEQEQPSTQLFKK